MCSSGLCPHVCQREGGQMPADDRCQVRASTVRKRSINVLFLLQTFSPIAAARSVKSQVELLCNWSKSVPSRDPSKVSILVLGKARQYGGTRQKESKASPLQKGAV